ncbi:MAG: hypothetical protein FJ278_00080 [Planctomycetes bacterium]|nr:hypothetical protein [Planctomycetota bacterium]
MDRLLTEAEQESVSNLSSHIEVSSSRAVVTYSYGSFKHDPRQVLARFFDAHLYLANWGSRRLMFRFPSGLVSRDMIETHCVQDRITFRTVNGFDVLDMDLSEEEGGGWIEGEGSLSGLIPLRTDILQGDYRSVYLAWLKAMSVRDGYLPRGRKSSASKPTVPAIPAGLKQLSPALKRFVEQFDVPACLVEAAAEHSPELAETVATDFRPLVARLPREECDRFLCRFAQGDVTAGIELKKHLLTLEPRLPAASGPGRSIDELLKRAEAIETARKRRQEQEARRKHAAAMKALAEREAETWQQVASLVDLKQTRSYDEAVQLLAKLAQLAEFRGSQDDYRRRVNDLCDRYKRLSGFRWRVQQARLLVDQKDEPMDQDEQ